MNPRPSAPPSVSRGLVVSLCVLALSLVSEPAMACAACGCGDPTLTSMGSEKPFSGRFRTAVAAAMRTDRMGRPGEDEVVLRERRLDLQLAWAPEAFVFLQLSVPILDRETQDYTLASAHTTGLGDVELRAKFFVYQDRAVPRHLLAITPGVALPTGQLQRDSAGVLLPMEAQPTAGVFSALLGVSYSHFFQPFSLYASLGATSPLGEVEGFRLSSSLRGTLALQHQTLDWLALRAGPDFRADTRAKESGVSDPHTGGLIAFASLDVMVSPLQDLLLGVGTSVPVLNALYGRHQESVIWRASAAYDW